MPTRLRILAVRAFCTVTLLAFANPLAAQVREMARRHAAWGGNDNIGGKIDYWGGAMDYIGVLLCQPLRLALTIGLVIGMVVLCWLVLRASRGDSGKWKPAIILLFAMALAAVPKETFGLLGFGDDLLAKVSLPSAIGQSCPTQ